MKGNPAVPGGSLTSKPTWSNTSRGVPPRRLFCLRIEIDGGRSIRGFLSAITGCGTLFTSPFRSAQAGNPRGRKRQGAVLSPPAVFFISAVNLGWALVVSVSGGVMAEVQPDSGATEELLHRARAGDSQSLEALFGVTGPTCASSSSCVWTPRYVRAWTRPTCSRTPSWRSASTSPTKR